MEFTSVDFLFLIFNYMRFIYPIKENRTNITINEIIKQISSVIRYNNTHKTVTAMIISAF